MNSYSLRSGKAVTMAGAAGTKRKADAHQHPSAPTAAKRPRQEEMRRIVDEDRTQYTLMYERQARKLGPEGLRLWSRISRPLSGSPDPLVHWTRTKIYEIIKTCIDITRHNTRDLWDNYIEGKPFTKVLEADGTLTKEVEIRVVLHQLQKQMSVIEQERSRIDFSTFEDLMTSYENLAHAKQIYRNLWFQLLPLVDAHISQRFLKGEATIETERLFPSDIWQDEPEDFPTARQIIAYEQEHPGSICTLRCLKGTTRVWVERTGWNGHGFR